MSPRRIGPPLAFALFILAFVGLLAWLGLSGWRPGPIAEPGQGNATGTAAQADATEANATGTGEANATDADRTYEETLVLPVEEAAKKIDVLLARAMEEAGGDPDNLRLVDIVDVDVMDQGSTNATQANATSPAPLAENVTGVAHMQYMEAVLESGIEDFVSIVARNLRSEVPEATLMTLDPATDEANATMLLTDRPRAVLRITVLGTPTHEVAIYSTHDPDRFGSREPLPPDAALLAIVIDDMGENMRFANDLALLDYPVTFSVWPRATKTWETAQIAFEAGLEVMVHQPMEPVDYPRYRPGPGALFTDMDTAAIRSEVAANIGRVPYASGLNNHMGSRLTQDRTAMAAVMDVLAAQHLFAVDSLTHPRSVLSDEAQAHGVPCVPRDVFLDVVPDVHSVLVQLDKAQQLALRRGTALAIGHPYPETLEGLRQWSSRRDQRVRVVTVRALLERRARAMAGD